MTLSTGQQVAAFARKTYGKDTDRVGKIQCWDAVLDCMQRAGGITSGQRVDLGKTPWTVDFSRVIPTRATLVRNAQEMRRVPAGAFIAFIEILPPNAYYRSLGQSVGMRGLKHAMLSLGDGWAAGIKNSCVGLAEAGGKWDTIDVAAQLNWFSGHRYDSFNAMPRSRARASASGAMGEGFRPMRIRYRTLSSLRETPSVLADPKRFQGSEPLNLKKGLTQETVSGDAICYSGVIGGGVAITATRRVEGLSTTFLWLVRDLASELTPTALEQDQAFKSLTTFLGGGSAQWAYYYGDSGSPALVDTVHQSWFHRQFVVDKTSSPTREYGGSRVWVDGHGQPQNLPELVVIR